MWRAGFIALCIAGFSLAHPPPPNRPPAPLPPRQPTGPSVLSPNVSALRGSEDFRLDRPPSVWHQIQRDLDRSNGYILPESLFQLDQLDLLEGPGFIRIRFGLDHLINEGDPAAHGWDCFAGAKGQHFFERD